MVRFLDWAYKYHNSSSISIEESMSDRLIGKSTFFGSVRCLFESSSLSKVVGVHSSMVEQIAFNYSVGSSSLPGPIKTRRFGIKYT